MTKFVFSVASLFLLGAFFWACQSDADTVKQAENDVFAIHDKVMPKIDDVMKLRKQLNQRIATLDSATVTGSAVGTLRTDEEKEQARLLSRNLTNADSLMMDWMSHYNGDTLAKLPPADALRYLSNQKDKINDVQTKLNTSIDQARQYLGKVESMPKQPKELSTQSGVKLKDFNNVTNLQNILSKNGVGALRKWRDDEAGGWISSTDYFSFGPTSAINATQNNLAYYLESDNENYVREMKLVLNIYNSEQTEQAIELYRKTVEKTFSSLSTETPKGLLDAIKNQKAYQTDTPNFSVSNKLDKSKIDTWKLTIETK